MKLLRWILFLTLVFSGNQVIGQVDLTVNHSFPDSICNGNQIPVTFELANVSGASAIGGQIQVSWTVGNGGNWNVETVSTTVNGGNSISHTFMTSANVSACGYHQFQFVVSYPGDINNANDTIIHSLFNVCLTNPVSLSGDTVCATQNQLLEVSVNSNINPPVLDWVTSNDGGTSWTSHGPGGLSYVFGNPQNGSIALAIFDGAGICPNDTAKMVLIPQPSFTFTPNQNALTPCTNRADVEVIIVHGNNTNDNIFFTSNGGGSFDDAFDDSTYYNFSPGDYGNNNLWIYGETILPVQCPFKDSIPINWLQAPTGVVTSNSPFCEGDTARFQASGGFQYFWFDDPDNLSSATHNGSLFEYVMTQSDTVVAFIVAPNVCADTIVVFNIVTEKPAIQTIPDTVICPGDVIQLTTALVNGVGSTGITWSWSPQVGLNNFNIQSPFATLYDDVTYIVEATNQGGCTDSDTVNISFPPGVNFDEFPDTLICPGTTIILETNASGTVQWSPTQWMSNPNDPNPAVTPATTLFYVVQVDDGVCNFTDSIKVSVDSLAAEILCDSIFCYGEEFNASINGAAMASYFWMVDGNFQVGTTAMIHQPLDVDSMLVQCEMTTADGCVFMLSRMVYRGSELECGGEINNAFSPNGDGINDTWVINVLDGTVPNSVEIFTRYGDVLVSFENYDNVNVVWDGSNSGGKMMPSGTYYYVIEVEGDKVAGWVNISE